MDKKLWEASEERKKNSTLTKFQTWVEKKYSQKFSHYSELHAWSVKNPGLFWKSILEFFEVQYEGSLEPIHEKLDFLNYPWFPNVKLNFAQNLLRSTDDSKIALVGCHESGQRKTLTYGQLKKETARIQSFFKKYIQAGDVVAAYMPNIPETAVAMLATTSLGGIFTSTSCDFGVNGVVDRFGQTEPKILVTVAGYTYNNKYIDLRENIEKIQAALPSLKAIVIVDFLQKNISVPNTFVWEKIGEVSSSLNFVQRKFSDPLYIMYSSGTTGKPKCIVHSTGGVLLQHLKELGLHSDLTQDKIIFYFTTCGWMMWNWLVSSLSFGSTIVLYEGSPAYPSVEGFMNIIDGEKINIFGTSPKFLRALETENVHFEKRFPSLETVLSTGSPLNPEQFDYVYEHVKKDVHLASISGGTDIIGCFSLGNPNLPVYRGEIQCRGLGMDVEAFDEDGNVVEAEEGELVCKTPFPSQPVGFWKDAEKKVLKAAYFEKFAGVWYHGDFIRVSKEGTVRIFGRSDATLNPGGVRIGTAEIYRQTEQISYIADSLCVGKDVAGDVEVWLYVKLKEEEKLDESRTTEIKNTIRKNTTPRHVPAKIIQVKDIPYTRSGKKVELAVTRIINGKKVTNLEALANPECLKEYDSAAELKK